MSLEFDIFHKYNKLVARSLANPLTCHCGFDQALVMSKEQPALKCFMCGTLTHPNIEEYTAILEKVRKYFD